MTTHKEIVDAIAGHKKAGEILNPAYKDLTDQARRIFGKEAAAGREAILTFMRKGDDDPILNDLYYGWPYDSLASLGKVAKLAPKLKPQHRAIASIAGKLLKDWKPVADDLKDLKGKIVKATQKRAEAKAEADKVMSKKKADSSALIKIFESHMNEYISMAEKRAKEFVQDKLDSLKKVDWDLNKIAPPPNSRTMGASEYKTAQAKRDLYRSITKSTASTSRPGEPDIREPNKAMIDHYVEMNKKGAQEAYENFMHKMMQKIGKPVVDATMKGNIWTNAILTVTTDDNEQQVWHTQMILNFSKYQKMFNQFPSRRKK